MKGNISFLLYIGWYYDDQRPKNKLSDIDLWGDYIVCVIVYIG